MISFPPVQHHASEALSDDSALPDHFPNLFYSASLVPLGEVLMNPFRVVAAPRCHIIRISPANHLLLSLPNLQSLKFEQISRGLKPCLGEHRLEETPVWRNGDEKVWLSKSPISVTAHLLG